MGYHLGIDLGTTYAAAAVAREGRAETVPLGHRAAVVPTVLYLAGVDVVVGEAADRRAVTEPDRVARVFKRRIGDPTPIVVDGRPFAPEALLACVGRWMLDEVTRSEGAPPETVTLTYPATWAGHRLDRLRTAMHAAGVVGADGGSPRYIDEPTAAATFYASQRPLAEGAIVAVYDLGGGTFDATIVRRTALGFDVLGVPTGVDRVGGVDFDDHVLAHVLAAAGAGDAPFDPDDPATIAALARLRADCVTAKEALSTESAVTVPVLLPGRHTEVRVTRNELEEMIRPAIADTVRVLRDALTAAGVAEADVSAVLLVGGSSRIPLVGQLISAAVDRPVVVDARPKDAIALGAALHGGVTATPPPPRPPPPPPVAAPPPRRERGPLVAAVAGATVLVGAGALLLGGGDDPPDEATFDRNTPATSEPTATTSAVAATSTTAPVSFFSVEAGQCLAFVPSEAELSDEAVLASCEEEHQGEAIATFDLVAPLGAPHPGDEIVRQQARDGCIARYESFLGISFEASRLQLRMFRPSPVSWDLGDRRVYCVVHDNGAPMTGSVEGIQE